jgi:hypothetical protein
MGHGYEVAWLTSLDAMCQLAAMLDNAMGIELRFLQEHDQYLRWRHKELFGRS